MQKYRRPLLAAVAAAVVTAAAPAWSGPLVVTDVAPGSACVSATAPAPCDGGPAAAATVGFAHDVTDDLLPTDVITAARLTIGLADDGGRGDGSEKIDLTLDLAALGYQPDGNHDAVIDLTDLGALADGVLAVLLGAQDGDFLFAGSTLTVWATRVDPPVLPLEIGFVEEEDAPLPAAIAPVPGPASGLALGAGLVLAALLRATRRAGRRA